MAQQVEDKHSSLSRLWWIHSSKYFLISDGQDNHAYACPQFTFTAMSNVCR